MVAAEATHLLASNHVINLGSKIATSWWEAVVAFAVDAIVLVGVSLLTRLVLVVILNILFI